ncbi:hypothetical protein RCH09_000265 [Actimicrobium sp. GrIS 1.19]|uniref:DUF1203 domain-containing protein n=1 Tax=Actimicrobium sp. GrIS 1.19 TaxID=3071708 RepID=UPI002E04C553|nr:hypothetical protein [Actimicrobium sp. GrIS 1.19]
MDSFQLIGLAAEPFAPLFALSDQRLIERNMRRVIATGSSGYPCRVSLDDAEVGDELLLLEFVHQPAASPYRSSGPIFVRKGVAQKALPAGTLTDYVRRRMMSVRAYDAAGMMLDASLCDGKVVDAEIMRLLANQAVDHLHLHNATRGCFSCRVNRA